MAVIRRRANRVRRNSPDIGPASGAGVARGGKIEAISREASSALCLARQRWGAQGVSGSAFKLFRRNHRGPARGAAAWGVEKQWLARAYSRPRKCSRC